MDGSQEFGQQTVIGKGTINRQSQDSQEQSQVTQTRIVVLYAKLSWKNKFEILTKKYKIRILYGQKWSAYCDWSQIGNSMDDIMGGYYTKSICNNFLSNQKNKYCFAFSIIFQEIFYGKSNLYLLQQNISSTLNYFNKKRKGPMDAHKRYSPMKYTKSTTERRDGYSPLKKNQQRLHSNKYFYHFANGMYMGGLDCFKKSGQGILLLDDGACILCTHSHDNMVGHNIIFRNHSITSLLIDMARNKNVCFRFNQYLLQFSTTNMDEIEGTGYFIDYSYKKIFKLFYRHSLLERKIKITDQAILKKVFDERDATGLIHVSHARALDFDYDIISEIRHIQNEDEHLFGFCEKEKGKRGLKANGLSFRVKVNHRAQNFDISIEERGYFQNTSMHQFGQRNYENGNLYIGGFNKGILQGYGVLYDPKAKKWTYGIYYQGQLIQVLDSSVKNTKKSLYDVIRDIHKTDKSYIQSKIAIRPTLHTFQSKIEEILNLDAHKFYELDENEIQKLRNENLKRIHNDYTNRHFQRETEQAILKLIPDQKPAQKEQKKNKNDRNNKSGYPMTCKNRNNKLKTTANEQNRSKSRGKSISVKRRKNQQNIHKTQEKNKQKEEQDNNKVMTTRRAERYLKNQTNTNQLIKNFYQFQADYLQNSHKRSIPYEQKKLSDPNQELIHQRQRILELLRLERELQHLDYLKKLRSGQIDNFYKQKSSPISEKQIYEFMQTHPVRGQLGNKYGQRSRSRGSSGSAQKRYKYVADNTQDEEQLHKKLIMQRKSSPSDQI